MGTKLAFLVLGAEGSGTRLVTQLLIDAGCAGKAGHEQPYDTVGNYSQLDISDEDPDLVVLRRSVPHGRQWVSIKEIIEQLNSVGYEVVVYVVVRDWHAVCEFDRDFDILKKVYRRIFSSIEDGVDYVLVTYEGIVLHGVSYMNSLLKPYDLSIQQTVNIYNANEKYYS